jgi:hypothetical protein
VAEIKRKVHKARHEALRQANKTLIKLYWEIGKGILEKQEKYGWGNSIVEKLSTGEMIMTGSMSVFMDLLME